MKRIIFSLAVFLFAAAALGQVGIPPGVIYGNPTPGGACSAGAGQIVTSTGTIYTCQNSIWVAVGSTGGIANVVYATNYGVKADGGIVSDVSIATGSHVVTCPNSDCAFTSSDIGKTMFATNATTDVVNFLTTAVVIPEGTITAVTNANSITVSTTSTATLTGAATFVYGTLNSAPAGTTQTTLNDPLYAAFAAAFNSCSPLQLPAGVILIDQPEGNTYTAAIPCAQFNQELAIRRGFVVNGFGPTSTFLVPTPAFDGNQCTGPNGTGIGCLLSVPSLWLSNLQIYGAGQAVLNASFSGKAGVYTAPMPFNGGGNFRFNNVYMLGWGTATNGFQGVNVGGHVSGGISGGWINHLMLETFGQTSFVLDPNATLSPVTLSNSIIATCGKTCLDVKTGQLYSTSNLYGFQTPNDTTVIETGTVFMSTDDTWPYMTSSGAAALRVDGTAIATLTGDVITNSMAGGFGIIVTGNATVNLSGSEVTAATPQQALYAASGAFMDLGGNTISGAESVPGSGFFKKTPILIGHGTLTLYAASIASGGSQAVTAGAINSVNVPSVNSQSIIEWTPAVSMETVSGYATTAAGQLRITPYPTANFVNFAVGNPTSGAIIPAQLPINWAVYNGTFDSLNYGCGSSFGLTDNFVGVPSLNVNGSVGFLSNCYTLPISTSSAATIHASSGVASVAAGSGLTVYTGVGLFPAAQSSYITVGSIAGFTGPTIRMSTNGNGYAWFPTSNKIWALFNGSGSAPGGALSPASCPAVSAGQKIALSASGNVITCTNVTTSASFAYTDTANTFTTGYPGFEISNPDTITAFFTTAP